MASLQYKAKDGQPNDVNKAQLANERLLNKVEQFEERIRAVYPTMEAIPAATGANAADTVLSLPSTLSAARLLELGLGELAAAEKTLRIGACFDAISRLKDALGVRSFLTRHTRTAQGYNGATRGQDTIRRAESNVKRHGRSYRRSWQALDGLCVPLRDRRNLRPLLESDMTILGKWLEGEQYRSRGMKLPWIWTIMSGEGTEGTPTAEAAEVAQETGDDASSVGADVESWNREGERILSTQDVKANGTGVEQPSDSP